MTRAFRSARAALVLLLAAAAALPLASAQQGPPPGYTDPAAYAQDYAAGQAAQAQNDTAGYASGKATPEALANETEHAAWLACWSLYAYGEDAAMAADPVCAQFFTPPGQVDAPAEASAEITETLNGTVDSALEDTGADALLGETLDAVNDTLADPLSVLDQLGRVVSAVVTFAKTLLGFVVDLVLSIVDGLGLGIGGAAAGTLDALGGLLALLELPVEGLSSAASGLAAMAGAAVAGAAAAVDGLAAFVAAVASGLATGASATGDAVTGALDAAGSAVGGAASAVGDALDAVGDAVASLFGGGEERPSRGEDDGLLGGVETGTEADGLVDRVLGLV